MKKCLTVLLTAAMVLSLAACGGGKSGGADAKTIYDEATKKTQELTSMDMTSVIDMQMTQGEETVDMKMNMDMKIADMNNEKMRYSAEGTTSVAGQDMEMSMYYENGYYYINTMGQKIKYAMDVTAMMEQIKQSTEGASVQSDYLKDISAKKDGDNQVLTFTVDAAKMDSYVQDMMEGMQMANLEGVTYTIKDASGEAVVNKDGYFTSAKMKMTLEMTMQGETVSMTMDVDSTYNNVGQTVEVTAPDLEGYTEVDPSTMQ